MTKPSVSEFVFGVPEVLYAAAAYAESIGVSKINELPGAWIAEVDDQWTLAMNGHRNPVAVEPDGCMAVDDLAPFTLAVWFNGWLAGFVTPTGGTIAAGELANEDSFIAALARATESVDGGNDG